MIRLKVVNPADKKLLGEIVEMINAAYSHEDKFSGHFKRIGALRTDLESLLKKMEDAICIRAVEKDKTVGCIMCDTNDRNAMISHFAVLPEKQGKGVGQKLLLSAESLASISNCSYIKAQIVSHRKRILNWYKKRGYIISKKIKWNAPFLTKKTYLIHMAKKIS